MVQTPVLSPGCLDLTMVPSHPSYGTSGTLDFPPQFSHFQNADSKSIPEGNGRDEMN